MLLIRRQLLPLLRAASPLPSPIHHRAFPLLSTSASAAPSSLEDYLAAACGLAPDQACKIAKKALDEASKESKKAFGDLSSWSRLGLGSTSNPGAILALLSGVDLSRADIAAVVAADPLLLRSSVKDIGPRLLALRDCLGPGSSEEEQRPPKEKVAAKVDFFKRTLGCSESEVSIASSKNPAMLGFSDQNLTRKIEFLVNEVGMEPRYILGRPFLFNYSLEKRLAPRHCVMKVLRAKRLLSSNISFFTLARLGEKEFRLRFTDCHEDSVPGLAGYYATACAGDVPPEVQLSS
ncbi:unnamed protein product [Urochloa decumbens]|uniref:Uncharacterized protein n=1 Tax=Urochloa decumbens TaxID=240449 RepID=A0ABC9DW49_9POAL